MWYSSVLLQETCDIITSTFNKMSFGWMFCIVRQSKRLKNFTLCLQFIHFHCLWIVVKHRSYKNKWTLVLLYWGNLCRSKNCRSCNWTHYCFWRKRPRKVNLWHAITIYNNSIRLGRNHYENVIIVCVLFEKGIIFITLKWQLYFYKFHLYSKLITEHI